MKITAIIPARGQSKNIPKKNIVDLGGKPLLSYTICFCQKLKVISNCYVSTEDEEIKYVANSYGAEVINRPAEHSADDSTDNGFLEHFFSLIPCEEVALMRPTTPLRDLNFVERAVTKYFEVRDRITGFRSLNEINESPYKVFRLDGDSVCRGFFDSFGDIRDYSNLPRQTFPKTYKPNGHIDVVKKSTLHSGSVFGDRIYGFIGDRVTDIDDIEDLKYARYQINTKENEK